MIARIVFIFMAAMLTSLAMATEVKVLKWQQLQPDNPALRKTITSMSQEQKSRLMRAIQQLELKQQLEGNKVKPANLTAADLALLKELD